MSTGLEISAEIDLRAIDERLARLSSPDLSRLLEDVGAEVESQTRRRIQSEKVDSTGREWPAWTEKYAATRHAGQSLLQSTNALLDSIEYRVQGDEVLIGSHLIYAATHQYGDPERNIIERPFLGLSDENEAAVTQIMTTFLDGIMA